ncbi:ankyrin repeat domain-containing protein [Lacinutrix mariniflava]|uniref:ankyrin repeat domain-containing protein n=1 Tax=Lacinutrix mariniflava TaxID=342955 RepID=UPI001F4C6874|nr:ankyrin repeat domain-containing protein [Lacinutrix mariniflava]
MGVSFNGNVAFAKYLIDNGANLNATNNNRTTALTFATQYNKVDIVKLLLEHNADISIKYNIGKTALDYAIDKSFTEIIPLLR